MAKKRRYLYIRAGRKVERVAKYPRRVKTMARRTKFKKKRSGSRSGMGSLAPIIGGVGAGLALSFAGPYLQRYIPNIGPVSSAAVSAIVLGAGVKLLLKKDPMRIPSSLMILGGAMVGASLLSGQNGSVGTGVSVYANDM